MVRMHPRNRYEKGADKERRIVNRARAAGCLAFRSARSLTAIDVFILNEKLQTITLVQSKIGMSENEKKNLENSLKHYEGIYQVIVRVE